MIPTTIQRAKTHKRISKGLQSPDFFAEQPIIGVMLFLFFSLIFGVLAYYVQQKGALVQWDLAMENRMHETALSSSPWIKNIMLSKQITS